MDLTLVLAGVLPPVLATLLLVTWRGQRMLPLGVAIGLLVAFGLLQHDLLALLRTLSSGPNAAAWLCWGLLAAATLSLLERSGWITSRLAAPLSLGLAFATLWASLCGVASHWSTLEAVLVVGACGLVAALSVAASRRTLQRGPGGAMAAVVFTVVLSMDAGVVTLGETAFGGQLCGAVAAAIGAAIGARMWRTGAVLQAADAAWLGLAHAGFLLFSKLVGYADWPATICALTAVPLLGLLPRGLAQRSAWRWLVCALPLSVLPLAVALWLAAPQPSPYGY